MVGYGGEPQGQGVGPRNGESAQTRFILQQQQGRGNGLDFAALSQAQGVATGLHPPLPALDFAWTWKSKDGLQQGWRVTVNTDRGGLEMQRGRLDVAHARTSQSSLIADFEELVLPFETITQKNNQSAFSNQMLLHARLNDEAVMTPYLGFNGTQNVYSETSPSDPTVIARVPLGGYVYSLATVVIAGVEHLIVLTAAGAFFYRDLSQAPVASIGSFTTLSDAAPPGSSGTGGGWALGSGSPGAPVQGLAFPGTTWGGGQTTSSYIGQAIIQSPAPGNPLLVRTSNALLAIPVEASQDNANVYTQVGSLMLSAIGLGACQPIGFQRVGNLQPAAYWWEYSAGGPATPGFRSRIASCDADGTFYQVHRLSVARILGAAGNPQRGSIVVNGGDRVVDWSGKETDLRIFGDESPKAGYKLFCVGVTCQDGQTYALVNELPYSIGGTAEGSVRSCWRRYDYELMRWRQVSEWLTLTNDGLITWANGQPFPVATSSAGPYGYMSAYGAPDLPFGPVTRALHSYAAQAAYTPDLTGQVALNASADVTWYHKFEAPAETNPFSLRGGVLTFATTGTSRKPAFVFPSGYEMADKYIDGIEWNGQDTGGVGSSVTIRIGEGGTLDNPSGALHRTFVSPINHMDRAEKWPDNQTSLLFPQVEVTITRGLANLTPQAYPFTIYGHVDLPATDQPMAWMPPDRSLG